MFYNKNNNLGHDHKMVNAKCREEAAQPNSKRNLLFSMQ